MNVLKRNGKKVEFNSSYIDRAIQGAMSETEKGVDKKVSADLAEKAKEIVFKRYGENVLVEDIQNVVEEVLMRHQDLELFKRYVIYRKEKEAERLHKNKNSDSNRMLTDAFISKYKHKKPPMTKLGEFVYNRTYSRYLIEDERREEWWETVRRAVEYNSTLVKTSRREAEELFDNIFHLRQFLSGRTFWIGNSPVSKDYPMGNFNCSFTIMSKMSDFGEIFYLLMVGSGAGIRILRRDIKELPKIRTDIEMVHEYVQKPKDQREEFTSIVTKKDTATIYVGDSKEGWRQAVDYYFSLATEKQYKTIKRVIINYDNVRPKGERLKSFGGTASGHQSLKRMFLKFDSILKKRKENTWINLKPINVLDFVNIIAENVVSGGVRRSSIIALIDPDDKESINAKENLYIQKDGKWVLNQELSHRQMSNNSIFYEEKPKREFLNWQIDKMRFSGEPGWINAEHAIKRLPSFKGVNPCGEILLDSKGMCNLTTLNVVAFIREDGTLDLEALLRAEYLSARASYRMTEVEMELHEWNKVLQREKVVGCSMTGWQDAKNILQWTKEEEIELLQKLRNAARRGAEDVAQELGHEVPRLVTTIKPEGTLSQLPTVSSGLHYSHSPYYIRRVRINSDDPLVKAVEDLGWVVKPEVGQTEENCTTKVVEFPVKAPEGTFKHDVSAIEQLENYKMFMEHYVDHNASITIHVRENEWDDVKEWVFENWDCIIGLSFIALDDSFYELLPYEKIEKEEYERRLAEMKPFRKSLLNKYETKEIFEKNVEKQNLQDDDCDSGICPIR